LDIGVIFVLLKKIMRLTFYTLAFMLLTTGLFGQLKVESGAVKGKSTSERVALYFTVTNTSDQEQTFYWDLERSAQMPSDWELSVCDTNTCYDWGSESCPCDEPAKLAPGEEYTFIVNVDPNGIEANYGVDFRLLDKCEDSKVLDSGKLTYNISNAVTSEKPKSTSSSIVIYPNPTFDTFEVTEDSAIKTIAIYNIVGKKVMSVEHRAGQLHDVTTLDEGIYLVRMLDATNEVVKVIRMTKE
jgi:hypothetical protein